MDENVAIKEKTFHGQTDHTPKPHTSTYDWREYDPKRYSFDPYAKCNFPEGEMRKKLDTPQYQNMSAMCKEELIW